MLVQPLPHLRPANQPGRAANGDLEPVWPEQVHLGLRSLVEIGNEQSPSPAVRCLWPELTQHFGAHEWIGPAAPSLAYHQGVPVKLGAQTDEWGSSATSELAS